METLATRIVRDGPLDVGDAVGWIIRLARALEPIHALGVAHGNITAGAIKLEAPSCTSRGALIDASRVPVQVSYHSPERLQGAPISPESDTWAAAVTLYVALTGSLPFPGREAEGVKQKIMGPPPSPLAVFDVGDDGLQGILDRAFRREPAGRLSNVRELREALEEWHPHPAMKHLPPLGDDDESPAAAAAQMDRPTPLVSVDPSSSFAMPMPDDDEDVTRVRTFPSRPQRAPLRPVVAAPAPAPAGPASTGRPRATTGALPRAVKLPPVTPPPPKVGPKSSAPPPASSAAPPVSGAAPPVSGAAPPVSGAAPPVSGAAPPVSGAAPVAASPVSEPEPSGVVKPSPGLASAPAPIPAMAADSLLSDDPSISSSPGRPAGVPSSAGAPSAAAAAEKPAVAAPSVPVQGSAAAPPAEAGPDAAPPVKPRSGGGAWKALVAVLVLAGGAAAAYRLRPDLFPGGASGSGSVAVAEPTSSGAPVAAPSGTPALSAGPSAGATSGAAAGTTAGAGATTASATASGAASAAAGGAASVTASGTASTAASGAASVTASGAASVTASGAASAAAAAGASGAAACMMPLFSKDAFVSPPAALNAVCTITDPLKGADLVRSEVILGGQGRVLSDSMREWGILGWYEMAVFAVLQHACCPSRPPLQLPISVPTCDIETPLKELAAAAIDPASDDAKIKAAFDAYTRAARCIAKHGGASGFGRKGAPQGGEDTAFQKTLERARAVAAKKPAR